MPNLLTTLMQIDHDITRHFQFDYILFDGLFLAIYVTLLVANKRFTALKAGIAGGIAYYLIDGVFWYLSGIREYGISEPWIKHPTDFMMDVSYGIVMLSWLWIAFEQRSAKEVALWTALVFAGWLLIPLLSGWVHLNDDPIMTVRHMENQVWLWIVVVLVGYAMLFALRYELKTILYVFFLGCLLGFMMEFPLLVLGIRPPSWQVLLYETVFLMNVGVPYLYVIWDRIVPAIQRRIAARRASSAQAPDRV
jgi:hypothetical protein